MKVCVNMSVSLLMMTHHLNMLYIPCICCGRVHLSQIDSRQSAMKLDELSDSHMGTLQMFLISLLMSMNPY